MEGLTHEQMLAAKRKRLQEAGIPANAGMMAQQTAVQNSASGSALAKIQAIKSGALQQDFDKFDKATGEAAPGPAGAATFQAIPEVKQRARPGQPVGSTVSDPKFSQKLESFAVPGAAQGGGELAQIEALMGGSSRSIPGMPTQRPMTTDLNIDSVMAGAPQFNPQAALANRNSEAIQEIKEQQQGFDYTKYALGGNAQVENTPGLENTRSVDATAFNYQKQMMEQIAEQTMKGMLEEITGSIKEGKTYTHYKNQKSIIKTPDGQIYQLVPLREGEDGKLYKKKK